MNKIVFLQHWETRTGYEAVVLRRDFMFWLNGYVRVPSCHPCYGKRYDKEIEVLKKLSVNRSLNDVSRQSPIVAFLALVRGSNSVLPTMQESLEVHGGVTFSGKLRGFDGWWIGFDTNHCYDLCEENLLDEPLNGTQWLDKLNNMVKKGDTVRPASYVREECELLAKQLKRIEPFWYSCLTRGRRFLGLKFKMKHKGEIVEY
jgi:hypothetical protein